MNERKLFLGESEMLPGGRAGESQASGMGDGGEKGRAPLQLQSKTLVREDRSHGLRVQDAERAAGSRQGPRPLL